MIRTLIVTILIFMSATRVTGQNSSGATHVHHMSAPNILDGSTNPERIPDKAAHRLFYVVVGVAPNATSDEKMRQDAHLRKIGLGDDDRKAVASLLGDFKVQYEAFMNRWNETAQAALARNQRFNPTEFLKERDALVQSTRNALSSALTSGGFNLLLLHINAEKSKMRVDAEEAQ
jgi:hypothetical protein